MFTNVPRKQLDGECNNVCVCVCGFVVLFGDCRCWRVSMSSMHELRYEIIRNLFIDASDHPLLIGLGFGYMRTLSFTATATSFPLI